MEENVIYICYCNEIVNNNIYPIFVQRDVDLTNADEGVFDEM